MKEKYQGKAYAVTGLLAMAALLGSLYTARAMKEGALFATGKNVADAPVVVIDAGHGGDDPGKVGVNQALEKDINLSIAKKVQKLLKQNGVVALLTREEDADLAEAGAKNRKAQDMKARVAFLKEEQPLLGISIHQNSYPSADCKGAQVFYYRSSKEGEILAKILQRQLLTELADGNTRQVKANEDYYLLKNSPCTFAIVECGFLSNPQEAELLITEEYQEKVAFAIHLGILEYINTIQAAGD
ncbi:MAG: N-acetylmuramoyl-L-alanine amidase [Lachnospiraceae bacterium]